MEEEGELAIESKWRSVRMGGRSAPAAAVGGRVRPAAEATAFEYVPLWGIAVFFLYAMRRVDCPSAG